MTRIATVLLAGLTLGACSQAGNTANSFGLVWVGPGTSATLTINAQTVTTPAAPASVLPVLPGGLVPVVPLSTVPVVVRP